MKTKKEQMGKMNKVKILSPFFIMRERERERNGAIFYIWVKYERNTDRFRPLES